MRVSVVIPVRDDAALLARCLQALDSQLTPPDEVIVVDNASSDASAAIAASAGARVLTCSQVGIAPAAATGYDAAKGDLILRLDADCVPAPTWVQDVVAAFRVPDAPDAVTGGAVFVDGPRPLQGSATLYLRAYALASGAALGHRPLFGSNMALTALAWRCVRDEVHRHDPEIHDDLDLSFHIGRRGRIARLPGRPMGISMRPFFSGRGLLRRLARGFRTVFVHWPAEFPPDRWRRAWRRR